MLEALAGEWRHWRRAGGGQGRQAEAFTLGVIDTGVVRWPRAEKEIDIANAAVTVTRGELAHATRASKARRGAALDEVDLDRLPEIVARPEGVLYDTKRPGELLYVFAPAEGAGKGKVVVRVNYTDRLKLDEADRSTVITNSVRTAGYVQAGDLRESRYEPIQGAVE